MQNYKIKVNDKTEGKEAQELFEKLGYKPECFYSNERFPRWVETTDAGEEYWYSTGSPLGTSLDGFKELTLAELRDLVAKSKPTEQGLIGGADALRALADGKEVEFDTGVGTWHLVHDGLTLHCFDSYKFRLKPSTITLNGIEIPAPFEPSEFEEFYVLSSVQPNGYIRTHLKSHALLGAWRTEDEIKQVVAALRGALKNG